MSTFWTDLPLWPKEFDKREVPNSSRPKSTSVLEKKRFGRPSEIVSRQQFILAAGVVLAIIASGLYLAGQYLIL